MKRKFMAAGAAVSMAGVVAGALIALAGGQDAGRPLDAAPVRAQHVDLNNPSAGPGVNFQEKTYDVILKVGNMAAYVGGVCVLDDENKSCNTDIANNFSGKPSATLTAKVPSGQSTIKVQGWAWDAQIHNNISDFPNAIVSVHTAFQDHCLYFGGNLFSFSFEETNCPAGS